MRVLSSISMCEFEQCSECCDPDYVLVLTKARGTAHKHIGK